MADSPASFGVIQQFDFQQYNSSIYISFRSLIMRTICICLGSFYVGFTLVYYYTMTQWYCIALDNKNACHSRSYFIVGAIIPLAAIFSSLFLCPLFQRYFSRRYILIIGSILGIIGGILMIICYTLGENLFEFNLNPSFITGRILHGLSVGLYMTFCLVTINQFSPVQLKMGMIGIYQLSIELGIIITNCTFLLLAKFLFGQNAQSWRYINSTMFALSIVILMVQFFLLLFVYKQQTPVYLINKQKYQEAKNVISNLYHKEYVNQKFLELKAEINLDSTSVDETFDSKQLFWKGLFLGVYAIIAQQMSGINLFNTIGMRLNIDNIYSFLFIFMKILPQICQLLGTIFLLVVNKVDKLRQIFGKSRRKRLFNVGTISCCVIMFIVFVLQCINYTIKIQNEPVWIILQCSFMFMYGFTLGPVGCLYISQLLTCFQMQLVIGVHWILTFFNMYGFALMQSYKSTRWVSPLIFFLICLCLSILNKWYIVQTKNQVKLQIFRKIDSFQICFLKKRN